MRQVVELHDKYMEVRPPGHAEGTVACVPRQANDIFDCFSGTG